MTLLYTAESNIPALQARNHKLGVTYADLVNVLVVAILDIVETLVLPEAGAEPGTVLSSLSGPEEKESETITWSQLYEALQAHEDEIARQAVSPANPLQE